MPGFSNSVMYAENVDFSGGAPVAAQVTTNGQLLIGSTAAPHIKVGTLTAGTGVSIVNGSGSITINAVGGGVSWQTISASQTLSTNNGYICTGGAALALLLPPVSSVGDMIAVTLDGSSSFQITQGAGQTIKLANATTSSGIAGSAASTQQGDTVLLVCSVANLRWNSISELGNLTIV